MINFGGFEEQTSVCQRSRVTTSRIDPNTLAGRPCSLAAALQIIGDRWALLAVREVMFGNHQFSQIARNTGAPRDRLAVRLKELVAAGVLERRAGDHSPSRPGYYLTAAGRDLAAVNRALLNWGDKWAVTAPPMKVRHHRHKLMATAVCATCGETIDDLDITRQMTAPDWTMDGPAPDRP